MSGAPAATIAVGVIVERVKAASPWIDFTWRPTAVLAGQPDTPPWTALADDGERATFYAGPATVELHRTRNRQLPRQSRVRRAGAVGGAARNRRPSRPTRSISSPPIRPRAKA